MKNLMILACFLIVCTCQAKAQSCTQTGASINTGSLVIKNIKTDFGAVGDGIADDHQAFKDAAECINTRGGDVKLIIPNGIYLVGRQTSNIGVADYDNPVYAGDPVLLLEDVENVVIEGEKYAHIRYHDGLKFGTFVPSTGLPPANINQYNPGTPGMSNSGSDYTYAGTVGNFLEIVRGNNIRVTNLEIDGNNTNYSLGGNWGDGTRPIELKNCYGVFLTSVKNSDFSNLRIHHFGVDNLYVNSSFTGKSPPVPVSTNLIFDGIICEYSGRTNFSWAGGENICVLNSAFNHAANKEIRTKPGYGFNIEPEGDTTFAGVSCTNGFFYNNVYGFNRGLALTAGTSLDNPVHGVGFGYSYGHYFKKCILVGKHESSTHNAINRITFDSCAFYGQVLSRGSSIDATDPAVFKNSYFSDCYNGEPVYSEPLLSFDFSYKAQILNNTFKKFIHPGVGNNFIFDYNVSAYPCSTDTYKPIIEDCTFWYYPAPQVGTPQYASNSRQTLFENNSFYKANSDQIRWGYLTGCPDDPLTPYGEGNVDLGNGFQEFNTVTDHLACSTQLVCEPSIYLSEELTEAKAFRSLSTFFADELISLSSETVTADAQDYIQLNPGFESDLTGTASIELQIETCAYGSGLLRVRQPPVKKNTPPANIPPVAMVDDVLVFPNPSSGDFNIQINNGNGQNNPYKVSYELYNATSKLIQQGRTDCTDAQCNRIVIRNIKSAGIYYLKLNYNNKVTIKKLVRL